MLSEFNVYAIFAKEDHLSRKEERASTVERRLAASFEDFPKKSSMTGVRPCNIENVTLCKVNVSNIISGVHHKSTLMGKPAGFFKM